MPTPPHLVRRAIWDDADALVALRHSMYEAMGVPADALDDDSWQAAFRAWLGAHLNDPATMIAVAVTASADGTASDDSENDEVVMACAIGEVTSLIPGPEFATGRVGLLSNVSTLAPYRGRGLGAACTDAVLDWMVDTAHVERIDLFATAVGEPIYLRRGFERRRFPALTRRVNR